MNIRAKVQRDVSRLLHHGNSVGIANPLNFAIRTFECENAAVDGLRMLFITQMKAQQAGARLPAGFSHVLGKAENAVDRADDGKVADESSFAFDAIDPTLLFEFVQRLAGGGVADLIFFDDVVLGRNRAPGRERPALDAGDDVAADLKVFWWGESIVIRAILSRRRFHWEAIATKRHENTQKKPPTAV